MRSIAVAAAFLLSGLAATGVAASRLYLDGPPPGHTGGFGEPDCTACHFDHPLDAPGGRLRVSGFPAAYEPGATYRIEVEVGRPGTELAGFQAAVRHRSGPRAGGQAGSFAVFDDRAVVVDTGPVAYVQHTVAGTAARDGAYRWSFAWTAPDAAGARLVLHAAANAANGDNSEFGDYIYLAELVSRALR